MLPSASVAAPVSETAAPADTAWSAPAFATGIALTVTVTVSECEAPPLSVTVSWKVIAPCDAGAVNDGVAVPAEASVTAVPSVCVQAQVLMLPLVSALPPPSRLTVAPGATTWSLPALATGGVLTGVSGGSGESLPPPLSQQPASTNASPAIQGFIADDLFIHRSREYVPLPTRTDSASRTAHRKRDAASGPGADAARGI